MSMFRIQRRHSLAGQCGQTMDAFIAPRRAAIDSGFASGNSVCIGRAVWVAAARALGLRQQCVDTFGQTHKVKPDQVGKAFICGPRFF